MKTIILDRKWEKFVMDYDENKTSWEQAQKMIIKKANEITAESVPMFFWVEEYYKKLIISRRDLLVMSRVNQLNTNNKSDKKLIINNMNAFIKDCLRWENFNLKIR